MIWEQNGLIVIIFGRRGLLPPPLISSCTIVLAKRFLHDGKRGKLKEVAFLGLIQSLLILDNANSKVAAICSALSLDLAGSASDQEALEHMLSEFTDVFEKPG